MSQSASGSSRHPQPLDVDALRDADVLLLAGGLATEPLRNPEQQFAQMCGHITKTLQQGGQCLIPCAPTGAVYDLLEYTSAHLASEGLGNVPIVFVSPAAEASLAYANIFAEWLCEVKQERVYRPAPPFLHHEQVAEGRLTVFSSVTGSLECSQMIRNGCTPAMGGVSAVPNSSASPRCVIFCGHPSLRCGDTADILSSGWAENPVNCLLCIDPDTDYKEALMPYADRIEARVFYTPIDLRLTFQEMNGLVKELRPKYLLTPDIYLKGCISVNSAGSVGDDDILYSARNAKSGTGDPSRSLAKMHPPATPLNAIVPCDGVWILSIPSSDNGENNSSSDPARASLLAVKYTSVPEFDGNYERAFLNAGMAASLQTASVGGRTSAAALQGKWPFCLFMGCVSLCCSRLLCVYHSLLAGEE